MQPLDIPIHDVDPNKIYCPDCGSTDTINITSTDLPVGYDEDERNCEMYLCMDCDHEWVVCEDDNAAS